jgi:hypothetical protein
MTRFIHDKFAKDYLEELLKPYGKVEARKPVSGEVRYIDVFFSPFIAEIPHLPILGLLGQFASIPAIFEPFRNPAAKEEIRYFLQQELEVISNIEREAKRNKTILLDREIPKTWILTPTASVEVLTKVNALPSKKSLPGIYCLGEEFRTAIVVIHQLPKTPETLWLRILGRGTVQKRAIDEIMALPQDHPYRRVTLELLYNLQQNLKINQAIESDDRELIMRLAPLYQEEKERIKQEGRQEGEQRLILLWLTRKFGELDSLFIEQIQALSVEQLDLLGEAVIDFSEITQLETWLRNIEVLLPLRDRETPAP